MQRRIVGDIGVHREGVGPQLPAAGLGYPLVEGGDGVHHID